ncbi:type III-B CRISPR module RAMP protein Cmr6 [Thermomonas fusca]
MAIELYREALKRAQGIANGTKFIKQPTANAGLLLRRGLTVYETGKTEGDAGKGGGPKQQLILEIAKTTPSGIYKAAFQRWKTATAGNSARFIQFQAPLIGRLYIGLSRETALETGITVHHAYGMPTIPGSALKGLARSVARDRLAQRRDALTWMFGNEHDVETPDAQETGAVIFHDAWWVPEGDAKPFVEEIVTPHHGDYYGSEGKQDATDFDSPNPAPQIAAQGSFLFVLEGDPAWCEIARTLLMHGLSERGIGGKTTSGYGLFKAAGNS